MIFWKRLWLHGLQQKGVQMFNKEHLDKIDRNYFNVIIADDRNVTLQSRNVIHHPLQSDSHRYRIPQESI